MEISNIFHIFAFLILRSDKDHLIVYLIDDSFLTQVKKLILWSLYKTAEELNKLIFIKYIYICVCYKCLKSFIMLTVELLVLFLGASVYVV